jgi:hypothetical protein
MTTGGWFVMILSVGSAMGFFAFCILRVVKAKDAAREHSAGEADDEDFEENDERADSTGSGN